MIPFRTITKYPILKFCQKLEEEIQEEIQDAYPNEWTEDYITLRIAKVLRGFSYSQIEYLKSYQNIIINAYKLKGQNETKFGDLAIVINIENKDGDSIKGVAFLEAKRRYKNSNEFQAMKFDQLERIYSNAPNAKLLLYNYQPMSIIAPTGLDVKVGGEGILPKMPVTFSSIAPLNTAIKLGRKDERIQKITIPFSYQFAFRYLFGFDLEFHEDLVNAAEGFFLTEYQVPSIDTNEADSSFMNRSFNNKELGNPDFIISVTIKPGRKDDKELLGSFNPRINTNLYGEIKPNPEKEK